MRVDVDFDVLCIKEDSESGPKTPNMNKLGLVPRARRIDQEATQEKHTTLGQSPPRPGCVGPTVSPWWVPLPWLLNFLYSCSGFRAFYGLCSDNFSDKTFICCFLGSDSHHPPPHAPSKLGLD